MAAKSDAELVEAVLSGNAECFTELCLRYYSAMVAIAHSIIGDRHLAEDASQEAFARACRELPRLRNKEKFAVWLAAICRNASKDIARLRQNADGADGLSTVAAKAAQNPADETVKEAVSKLPASARELIYLRYYDGMTYEQMSALLGISEAAINGRLARAKKKITVYLRRKGFKEVR